MRKTHFAAVLAACLIALSGCGDSTTPEGDGMGSTIPVGSAIDTDGDGEKDGVAIDTNGDGTSDAIDTNGDGTSDGPIPAGASVVGNNATNGEDAGGGTTTGASTGGNMTGGASTGETTSGGATAGTTTGGVDAGVGGTDGGAAACTDKPSTLGNDCPGVVTCTEAVNSCSVATQNCCVKDYDPKAVSCNGGSTCDGLAKAVCDGPEDCGKGQLCCISVSVGLGGSEIKHRCVADTKACSGGVIANNILCHTDADCAASQTCGAIGKLPWWGICK